MTNTYLLNIMAPDSVSSVMLFQIRQLLISLFVACLSWPGSTVKLSSTRAPLTQSGNYSR